MFIDQAEIYVRSGKGGDGAIHFRREKFVPRGGPDGGNGGKGGDVVLEVHLGLNTLNAFRHQGRYIAPDGEKGGRQDQTGRGAEDLVIAVPPGTLVYDAATGEVLGDLVEPGQRLVVAVGGKGGRGNARFATAKRQVPRIGEKGEPAQERTLRLELKLIADVGLVGVPNAGKSTLLASVSKARPKIAPYPFTTLEPNLGVANLDEDTSLVLADIPGLIEGAHLGIGLGHDFLRHIQRTRVLIHILDGLAEDPVVDFAQINSELSLFDPRLAQKPQVVVVNKMDLDEVKARWPKLEKELKRRGYEAFAISAATGEGVRPALWKAHQLLQEIPLEEVQEQETPVYRPESNPNDFTITRQDNGDWVVVGEAIQRAARMTYWEYDESVRRFQKILQTLGVEDALRKAGVEPGDTVLIGDFELVWED